ncbi:MAG: formylmethanofuran dehydrogenase [Deltaproteobacteria bacterium]|nr:formylmethanofuran dehydrogenase [Deltaproteobacteria bacterium]
MKKEAMKEAYVLSEQQYHKCMEFHGHVCPGLSIGFRAAQAGLDWLKENRAEDEELVAIVETDACGADAIQVLTGCTFGKGNLLHRDYGKQAFTLLGRRTGRGVRVCLRPGALELTERHRQLMERIQGNEATKEERNEFGRLHQQKSREILEKPLRELFTLKEISQVLPLKARIEPSRPCQVCREPVMASKIQIRHEKEICRSCLEEKGAFFTDYPRR